jgi:hypothetical protein
MVVDPFSINLYAALGVTNGPVELKVPIKSVQPTPTPAKIAGAVAADLVRWPNRINRGL